MARCCDDEEDHTMSRQERPRDGDCEQREHRSLSATLTTLTDVFVTLYSISDIDVVILQADRTNERATNDAGRMSMSMMTKFITRVPFNLSIQIQIRYSFVVRSFKHSRAAIVSIARIFYFARHESARKALYRCNLPENFARSTIRQWDSLNDALDSSHPFRAIARSRDLERVIFRGQLRIAPRTDCTECSWRIAL